SGALIAIDRRDRRVGAMLRLLQREGVPLRTSAGAVAQVWWDGGRQVNLARILSGVDVSALDEVVAKKVGELVRANGTNDVVEAHVSLMAQPQGSVLTSDEADITRLLRTRRVKAAVVR